MNINELNEKDLRTAINLYYEIAYEKKLSPSAVEGLVISVKEQIMKSGYSANDIGLPGWIHAKFRVGDPNWDPYCYWVDTNDIGDEADPNCNQEQNLEYKLKIESAWREANLPVRE